MLRKDFLCPILNKKAHSTFYVWLVTNENYLKSKGIEKYNEKQKFNLVKKKGNIGDPCIWHLPSFSKM